MTTPPTPSAPDKPAHTRRQILSDDLAYVLPMAVFLLFTWIGGQWSGAFATSYVLKTLIVPVVIVIGWRHYTRIRWTHLWLGVVVGIVGLVQWVGMETLLVRYGPSWTRMPVDFSKDIFNPFDHFAGSPPAVAWAFILIRWAGASLVVPVMEELFWRDFLWRSIQAPNDFKLAEVGEPDYKALAIVSALFATVHIQWLTAIVWGLLVGLLLIRTRSLGACIVAHGVTNFLLGAYVLWKKDWYFW